MTEENLQSARACLECSQPLGPGRSDRKFCNDICRTAFNNRRRTEDAAGAARGTNNITPLHQKIFAIILHNRNLLEKAYYYYDEPVFLKNLLAEGFDLKFFTSEHTVTYGATYKFCLDFGYHIRENDEVDIIERLEEIF